MHKTEGCGITPSCGCFADMGKIRLLKHMKKIGIAITSVHSIPDEYFPVEFDDKYLRGHLIGVINDIPAEQLLELFEVSEIDRDEEINKVTYLFMTELGNETKTV